jgi:hypothetical protein
MLVYGTGSFHQSNCPGGGRILICDSSVHDAGGVKVVESAIVVVGWMRFVGSAWGVWRAWKYFGDILAFVEVQEINSTAQPRLRRITANTEKNCRTL